MLKTFEGNFASSLCFGYLERSASFNWRNCEYLLRSRQDPGWWPLSTRMTYTVNTSPAVSRISQSSMFAARLLEKLIFSARAVPRGWLGPNCEARNSTTQQMSGHAGVYNNTFFS